jgi:lysozyme
MPTLLKEGTDFVKAQEMFMANPYIDNGGHLACGYGHSTVGPPVVNVGDVWTEEYSTAVLAADLELVGKRLLKLVTVPLSDLQFSALCSIAYNTGVHALASSEAIRLLMDQTITNHYFKCAVAIVTYAVSAKDKITGIRRDFLGLKVRRIQEAAMFLRGTTK